MQPEELDAIADVVVETVKTQTAVLEHRLEALTREPVIGPPGPAGKDAPEPDLDVIAAKAAALIRVPDPIVGPQGVPGQPGERGADAPPVDLREVAKQAAALIPAPKDGRDGADAPAVDLAAIVKQAAALVPVPKDGVDGTTPDINAIVDLVLARLVDMMGAMVMTEVGKAVAAIEKPKDGKDGQSVTLEQVSPIIVSEVTKAVDALPRPKDGRDGVGVAGALIDQAGTLVLTLSNGTVQPLGVVVGAKGDSGNDGKDGADGFGFDDLAVEHDGEQTVTLVFQKGERVKSYPVTFPVPVHKGTFDVTKAYERGHQTTWAGSTWQAIRKTSGFKPGDGPPEKTGWQLVTKKGSDGKSGKDGEPGKNGRDGKEGGPKW